MNVIDCAACGAANRPQASYCMRCGKPLPVTDCRAAAHARAFVMRELRGPFFSAVPQALDFSPASLAFFDQLIDEMWGKTGAAPATPAGSRRQPSCR